MLQNLPVKYNLLTLFDWLESWDLLFNEPASQETCWEAYFY